MSDKVGKADIAKALGMAQLQGAKEVFKEQMKEGLVGSLTPGKANPQVTTVMDQVAKAASAVRLNIQRRDPVSGKHTYLRGPGEVDAQLLLERGLPEIIDDWCGGGEYIVEISAPGQERLTQTFTVAGQPRDPGYRAQTAVASGVPASTAYDPSHYFGAPRVAYASPADNSSNLVSKMLEMMMAQQMLQTKLGSTSSSSSEVTELKAELARMREEQRRSEDERKRGEELERLRREQAEDRKRSEERFEKILSEMNRDKTPAWVGLAQAAMPIAAELMKGKDASMGLLSQTFSTVLQAQQSASNQQADTFKLLLSRPSAADEISKMTSVFAQSQLTNLQTINQIMSTGLLDKGGGHPVVELISQLIDQGGQVLQAAVGSRDAAMAGLNSPNEQPEMAPPQLDGDVGAPQLPAAATTEPQKQYDLNADPSFRVIIEQIRGGGDPREVALRLYRHGQPLREDQGHPLAKAWCRDPKAYSESILGQLGIPAERIVAIVNALVDLALWINEGKDPETFASVETRRRRRRSKSIPAVSPEMQNTQGYTFAPPDEDEDEDDDEVDDGGNGVSDPTDEVTSNIKVPSTLPGAPADLIEAEAAATEATVVG